MTDSVSLKESGISANHNDDENKEAGLSPPSTFGSKKGRIIDEIKSVLIFTIVSALAGYISFLLTPSKPAAIPTASFLLVLGAMIAVFLGTYMLIQKLLGKKDMKWIMGNGGAIYLFLWFVTWIIFYNAL